MDKQHILAEIRRTADKNGGVPLGIDRFFAETGIRTSDWQGKHWVRWGDALLEAGLQPNQLQGPRTDEDLLSCLATLAGELGHFPVAVEIKMKARTDPGFPWHNSFTRFGKKLDLVKRLHEFCIEKGVDDVAGYCAALLGSTVDEVHTPKLSSVAVEIGYVYLIKSGRYFKIGRSNSVGRRERELAIQLPEAAKTVHSISTDDPVGIEAYWHKRFQDRRLNGEWFNLTAEDVAAFKRRKFM